MSDSDSSERSNPEIEKQFKKKRTRRKSKKQKKNKLKSLKIEEEEKLEIQNLIEQFDSIFIEEQSKQTEKNIVNFTKLYLLNNSDNPEEITLNYKSFMVFIIKLCGLQIDIEKDEEIKKYINIKNSTCTDPENIDELVNNCKLRTAKISLHFLISTLNPIADVIYNCFDIIKEKDFEKFKDFIINMFKLLSNGYRKLRYISCIILSRFLESLYNEMAKTKKILKEKSKVLEKNMQNSLSNGTLTLLKNKVQIINQLILLLKENLIIKKIIDISKDIRVIIADILFKISKKHFNLLFQDQKLIKFYPFFLNDPSSIVTFKYLQLLYEELSELSKEEEEKSEEEENENSHQLKNNIKYSEEEEENLKIIVKILSLTRDSILKLCLKDDKSIARMSMRIIELLSFQKILEPKTVHQLLPHLFNPEIGIRALVSRIVISYILNFENENDNNIKHVHSIKDVQFLVEFTQKLTDNENKLVEIIVDNFFNGLEIFKNFQILFDFIDQSLNSSNYELYLIHTTFLIIKFSIKKIQQKIKNSMINFNPINNEFVNLYSKKIIWYLKKFRVPLFENIIQNTQAKILSLCLDLLNYIQVFEKDFQNITFDSFKEIISELIHSFFININSFGKNEINNKNENETFGIFLNNEPVIFEKICDNLLNGIHILLNNKAFFEFYQFNENILLSDFIYGKKEGDNSLKGKFISLLKNEIINTKIYELIGNNNSKDILEYSDLLDKEAKIKLYITSTQLNYMLIHFPKIFEETDINLFELTSFYIKILTISLKSNYSKVDLSFHFKFNRIILSLIETLHLFLFTIEQSNSKLNTSEVNNSINEYIDLRNNILNTIFSIANIDYLEDNQLYNNHLLVLKSNGIGIVFDMLTIINRENMTNKNLKFSINSEIENFLINFIRNNFIKFFYDYNKYLKGDNNMIELNSTEWKQDEVKKERKSMSYIQNSYFKNESTLKTFCLKLLAEKFSRLLLLNFSMFEYIDLSSLYFETFFLIQHMQTIENIVNCTIETLMDLEIQQFFQIKNNDSIEKNNPCIIAFYLTKITMKIFNEKSLLFPNEEFNILYEEKIEMIGRFLNSYTKVYKKLKIKYKDSDINIYDKDKLFIENFILNGMNFALSEKIPNKTDSKIIDIENVYFLEFIKMFLKTNLFFDTEDIKNFIIAYISMSKVIEFQDGINIRHLKCMEKFKNYLLNKGKLIISNNQDENKENDKDEISENEKEKENELEDEEKKNDIEDKKNLKIKKKKKIKEKEDNNNELGEKKKEENIKEKKNKRKSKKSTKRRYNEVIKEEDENIEEENQLSIKKMKKE